MDLMAADIKHNYSPPVSRGPTSAQVFMLLLEVQEAWCKDWPSFIQVLTCARALRAVGSVFPVESPHLWNLV